MTTESLYKQLAVARAAYALAVKKRNDLDLRSDEYVEADEEVLKLAVHERALENRIRRLKEGTE